MKTKTNICLLNDSFPPVIDGVANAVLNYAEILSARQDTSVSVGTPYYPDTDYSSYPFPVYAYPSLDTSTLTGGYRAGYPLPVKEIALMAKNEPDIIHTHCPINSLFVARSLRDLSGAPIILTYHTKYDIDIRRSIAVPILQEESIRALVHNISACDEIWAVSRGAGENLQSLGYEGTFKVMPNGVDFPKGRVSPQAVQEAVAGYDLPDGVPVFLFVGRMMNYKGLPLLIDALHQLGAKQDYRMVMIGQGADLPALQKKISSLQIPFDVKTESGEIISRPGITKGKFIFTGAVTDRDVLKAWNGRADLFVFPSTFDTNGLVVREAAAGGLASLLIRNSCAAEGIEDGRNGYLCDENADSIAAFLKWACGHLNELHIAGEHAMQEIYLSWQDAVNLAVNGYNDLLERKRSGKLKAKKQLGDDPLYTMAADAAILYERYNAMQPPDYEGMLDNFISQREERRKKLLEDLQNKKTELQDFLLQRLNRNE